MEIDLWQPRADFWQPVTQEAASLHSGIFYATNIGLILFEQAGNFSEKEQALLKDLLLAKIWPKSLPQCRTEILKLSATELSNKMQQYIAENNIGFILCLGKLKAIEHLQAVTPVIKLPSLSDLMQQPQQKHLAWLTLAHAND